MSFILDALKKSETDRQQQGPTEFASVPTGTAAARVPKWLWVVGVLLAINLVVLVGLLFKPDVTAPNEAALRPPVVSGAIPTTVRSNPASFEEKVAIAKQNPPEQQETQTPQKSANNAPKILQSDLISQRPATIPATDLYPSFDEVRASGMSDLPDLHIDIHVFSPEPKDRFVFINMSKLREGEQLAEGPVVAEITSEGVVLGHQGQFFILSRE